MKLLCRFISFLVFIFFSSLTTFGQEGTTVVVRDAETWSQFGAKVKASENIAFTLNEAFRFWNNSSTLDQFFTNVKMDLNTANNLQFALGYRFIKENDISQYETHQRFAFDADYKISLNRFTLKPRIRYQIKDELGISQEEGDELVKNLRFKMGAKYNIKNWKLDPYFSTEIFRQYENGTVAHFDKVRFTIETKFKTKTNGQFSLFYRLERQLNASYPKTTNILGIQYRYLVNLIKND